MKSIHFLSVVIALSLLSVKSFSQVTSVPEEAKSNFAGQYPNAQNVEWDNDIVNVNVRFTLDEEQMNAEYNNKGIWKSTLKESTMESLPAEVQDGFKKSKYAERDVTNVKVVYLPGNVMQYRLKVEKNDIQKKHLWFNAKGRLIRDANTL
jgi:Putative beta-lactamase-inhibitor-like, PepSY-like